MNQYHVCATIPLIEAIFSYIVRQAFAELRNSGRAPLGSLPVSLCQVPFLLTPEAKSLILQVCGYYI